MGDWVALRQRDPDRAAGALMTALRALAPSAVRRAGLPVSEAEDVAANAIGSIWSRPNDAEVAAPRTPFCAWLSGVLRNHARSERQRRERAMREEAPPAPDVERRLEIARRRASILATVGASPLRSMSGHQAHAVGLWLEGASFTAIGARMASPIRRDSAFHLVHRALRAAGRSEVPSGRSRRTHYPPLCAGDLARLNVRQRAMYAMLRGGATVAQVGRRFDLGFEAAHAAARRLRRTLGIDSIPAIPR